MNFEQTRIENDERLLDDIDAIRSGADIATLVPFAKAYLGMFYVIDTELPAREKLGLLASPQLAEAVLDGFRASLTHPELPSVAEIASACAEHREFSLGYVYLAGLDLLLAEADGKVEALPAAVLGHALAFHFSNNTGYNSQWFEQMMAAHKPVLLPVLSEYWVALLQNGATSLPGRHYIFSEQADADIVHHCVLPLLQHWRHCRQKNLLQLLQLAFRYADQADFLSVCEQVLQDDNRLNERTRLLWIASAYFLAPEKYASLLSSYVGRMKIKAMPLLDFATMLLQMRQQISIAISDESIVQLLRLIAPIFPPQLHVYGALGELDINSRNVMGLFYALLLSDSPDVAMHVKALRNARVMKIYAAVIDDLLTLLTRRQNQDGFVLPDFDSYIGNLVEQDCLQGRKDKFGLR